MWPPTDRPGGRPTSLDRPRDSTEEHRPRRGNPKAWGNGRDSWSGAAETPATATGSSGFPPSTTQLGEPGRAAVPLAEEAGNLGDSACGRGRNPKSALECSPGRRTNPSKWESAGTRWVRWETLGTNAAMRSPSPGRRPARVRVPWAGVVVFDLHPTSKGRRPLFGGGIVQEPYSITIDGDRVYAVHDAKNPCERGKGGYRRGEARGPSREGGGTWPGKARDHRGRQRDPSGEDAGPARAARNGALPRATVGKLDTTFPTTV